MSKFSEGGNRKPSPSRQEKHERPTPIVNHVPAEDEAATQVSPIFVPRPKRVIKPSLKVKENLGLASNDGGSCSPNNTELGHFTFLF